MKKSTAQMLELFFNPDETICVSHNKYGYHSVKQSDLTGDITLISPSEKVSVETITEKDINFLTINPIDGFRKDKSATAYRGFLIEVDDMPLPQQKEYVENEKKMPFSVSIYSGGKSIHYGIVLSQDLLNIKTWKLYNQWIHNILSEADQQNKNPTKSIRFPNNIRHDTQKTQSLIQLNGRVDLSTLHIWLNKFPNCKPKPVSEYVPSDYLDRPPTPENLPDWVKKILKDGIYSERNKTWHTVACVFAKNGWSFEDTVPILQYYYSEEGDFPQNEWLTCIKHGFKTVIGEWNEF